MAPTINLLAIDAEPNNCPLGDPLELKVREDTHFQGMLDTHFGQFITVLVGVKVNPPFPDLRHDLLSCGIVRAQGNIIAAFFARPPLVFKTDEAISGARWDVKYMVDFASKRQIVEVRQGGPDCLRDRGELFNLSL
eukprot:5536700-Pyramimonas_sp.AAC.1